MGKAREDYLAESILEATAYITYIDQGGTEAGWNQLSPEERNQLRVIKDPVKFLQGSDWCFEDFQMDPGLSRRPVWNDLPLIFLGYTVKISIEDTQRDRCMQQCIEHLLLQNYMVPNSLPDSSECHIGHLLHGMVTLVKKYHSSKSPWTRNVCILDLSDAKKSRLQNLVLDDIALVFVIASSRSHWALAAAHEADARVVIYDGKQNNFIHQKVLDWAKQVVEGECDIVYADVPSQRDNWSCGQRVLLATEYILQEIFINRESALPLVLPHDFASQENIQRLSTSTLEMGPPIETKKESMPAQKSQPKLIKRQQTEAAQPSESVFKRQKAEPAQPTEPELKRQKVESARRAKIEPPKDRRDQAPGTPPPDEKKKRSVDNDSPDNGNESWLGHKLWESIQDPFQNNLDSSGNIITYYNIL